MLITPHRIDLIAAATFVALLCLFTLSGCKPTPDDTPQLPTQPTYKPATRLETFKVADTNTLFMGSKRIGFALQLDDGRMMFPIRAINESLGRSVWWDKSSRAVWVDRKRVASPVYLIEVRSYVEDWRAQKFFGVSYDYPKPGSHEVILVDERRGG